MPFKSEAQRKKFWAMVGRGEMKRSTAEEWERATPKGKLPEHTKKAFVDELEKIARESEVGLSPSERRHQALQFGVLGLGTVPALAIAQEKIRTGRWLPKTGKGRFLAAAGLGGAFWGGLLPTLRHGLARRNLAKAQARHRAEQEMQILAPVAASAPVKIEAPESLAPQPEVPSV